MGFPANPPDNTLCPFISLGATTARLPVHEKHELGADVMHGALPGASLHSSIDPQARPAADAQCSGSHQYRNTLKPGALSELSLSYLRKLTSVRLRLKFSLNQSSRSPLLPEVLERSWYTGNPWSCSQNLLYHERPMHTYRTAPDISCIFYERSGPRRTRPLPYSPDYPVAAV
jgi:hypothetical protein